MPRPSLAEIVALDEDSFSHRFLSEARRRPPQLTTLASLIEVSFPDLEVRLETWAHEPYRKIGRLRRITGRRREGKRLLVLPKGSSSNASALFDHKSSEPYQTNWNVVRWIAEEARRRGLV